MKRLASWVAFLAIWLTAAAATARDGHGGPANCCTIDAGAQVVVALAQPLSTKLQRTGDKFGLRLAAPVVVSGWVVIPAGTPGTGEVVEATKPGPGGRPAKLVLAARYLTFGGRQLALEGMQLALAGKNNGMAAQAAGAGGMAFFPLGFVGLAVEGGDVEVQAGAQARAAIRDDVVLPPLRRATPDESYNSVALESGADVPDSGGAIDIPPPPPGMGQIVFFRPYTVLGIGQWFSVREHGDRIGKLFNGAYFVRAVQPGVHSYTAAFEPELGDRLTLEVAAGETYFVQGVLTKGVVLSAANLLPSGRGAFDRASRKLKRSNAPAWRGDSEIGAERPRGADADR